MDCREVRRLADAYVSDQVLVETAQTIGAHLEGCPPCRAEVDGLRRLRGSVRAAVLESTSEPLRPEFVAALRERLRTEAAQQQVRRAPRRWWLGLAAAAVLVVGSGLGVRQWYGHAWTSLLLAAAGDHQNCALTFKLSEDPLPIEEAARRFGGAAQLLARVELPTATATGGALAVIGRHSCVFEEQRFVHLVLRYRNETVSVLVTDEPRPTLASIGRADGDLAEVRTEGGFALTSFTGGRHAAFVVSALDADALREVAQAVSSPIARALAGA